MYNPDLLYKKTAADTGVNSMEVRNAVTHYFRTVKEAVRHLEAPAYYIDFIGTVYARRSGIEKEMKKLIEVYRHCKRFYDHNPVRNNKIITYVREEITSLNQIRKQLSVFYAQKKINRNSRPGKTILATQMGYYGGDVEGRMAEDKEG